MTADVDVRSQDPSWIHGVPIAQQCAGIGEASNPRQQQGARPVSPASTPTEEAPNGSVETTIPTTHSQAFTDETNNMAVESPVTQPPEDSSVPVPGSRRGKRIYYLAPVQCNTWTPEDYNRRFLFVKKELQSTVNGDPDCRDRAPYVSYELRMVGINCDQAVPSIVINCRERDMRSLKSLFARANKKLGRGKGSFMDHFPWAKPQTIPIPPLPLVYCGFKGGPMTQKMSDESITAYFGNESTYCGGLLQYQGASATLGLSLRIGHISGQLTVDHVFRSKRFIEPIAISAPGSLPSDSPLYDVNMDSLDDWCENDDDDGDSPNGFWYNDDDEYDYEDEPENGVEDEASDSICLEMDTATMKLSGQWETIRNPETLDPSLPDLDWALTQPLPRIGSPSPPIGHVNAFFPDGPGGHPVVISRIRDEPPVHLASVYVISGVRGVLSGHILAGSTFLRSPAKQADVEVWTVVVKSPQGLISGDCGSVVVDQNTHEAYGHVIGCNPWGHAFVVPLRHVLSQVKVSYSFRARVGITSFWDGILGLPYQSQLNQVYRQDNLSFIKQVLATGKVDVNSKDDRGQTPLHRVVEGGNEAVARLLLEHGVNKEAGDYDGQTPLQRAVQGGNEAVVRLLLEHGAHGEAKAGGRTPLHHAAREGNKAVARLLLEHGVNKEAGNYFGQTPLHLAAGAGHDAVVRLLLEYGAEKEANDHNYQTPLHCGAGAGHDTVVRLLLEYGADNQAKDDNSQTPPDLAAEKGHDSVVRLLLEHGADREAKGGGNKIPLYLAAGEEDEGICD